MTIQEIFDILNYEFADYYNNKNRYSYEDNAKRFHKIFCFWNTKIAELVKEIVPYEMGVKTEFGNGFNDCIVAIKINAKYRGIEI